MAGYPQNGDPVGPECQTRPTGLRSDDPKCTIHESMLNLLRYIFTNKVRKKETDE